MATVGGLVVYLTLNAVGLRHGLAQARAELETFRNATAAGTISQTADKDFGMIARAATVASLAILGIGAASVKAATQYQYEMKLLTVQTGASTTELKNMTKALLDMAPAAQHGPIELARGLFHIEAVGFRGARALEILQTAAQGARVGNAGLEDVTNALVAAMMSGIRGAEDLTTAMGTLNGIVGTGNIRMAQLAKSFTAGTLSTAKQFGISIQNLGAALATLADQGIPPQEAMTRLRISITLLGAPTALATRELARIGLTQRSLADEMRAPGGLIGALRLLKGHLDAAGLDAVEQSQLLKAAFGGARSSSGILTLINSLDLADQKLSIITDKMGSFPTDFEQQSRTAQAHFSRFTAQLEVIGIKIGNALLPIVLAVTDVITFLSSNTDVLSAAFLALTAIIGTYLVRSLLNMARGFVAMIGPMAQSTIGATSWGRSLLGVMGAQNAFAASTATTAGAVAAAGTISQNAMLQLSAGTATAATSIGMSDEAIAAAAARMAQGVVYGTTAAADATAAASTTIATHSVAAANALTVLGTRSLVATQQATPALLQLSAGVQTAMLQIPASVGTASRALQVYNTVWRLAAQGSISQVYLMATEIKAAMYGLSADIARAATAANVSFAQVRAGLDSLMAGPAYMRQTRTAGGRFGPLMTEAQLAARVIAEAAGQSSLAVETHIARMQGNFAALTTTINQVSEVFVINGNIIRATLTTVGDQAMITAVQLEAGLAKSSALVVAPVAQLAVVSQVATQETTMLGLAAGTAAPKLLLLAATSSAARAAVTGLGLGMTGMGGIMVGAGAAAGTAGGQLLLTAGKAASVGGAAAGAAPQVSRLSAAFAQLSASGASGSFTLGGMAAGLGRLVGITPQAVAGMGALRVATLGLAQAVNLLILPIGLVVTAWITFGWTVDKLARGVVGLGALIVGVITMVVRAAAGIPFIGDAFKGLADELTNVSKSLMDTYNEIDQRIKNEELAQHVREAGTENMDAYYEEMMNQIDASPLGQSLIDEWGTSLAGVQGAAQEVGAAAMEAYTKALMDGQSKTGEALKMLMDVTENSLDLEVEVAQNMGVLWSQAVADGMLSENPAVYAATQTVVKTAQERLDQLTDGAYSAGQEGAKTYAQALDQALSDSMELYFQAQRTKNEELMKEASKQIHVVDTGTANALQLTPEYEAQIRANVDAHNALVEVWNDMTPAEQEAASALQDLIDSFDETGAAANELETQISNVVQTIMTSASRIGDLNVYRDLGYEISAQLVGGVVDGLINQRQNLSGAFEQLHSMVSGEAWSASRQASFLVAQAWGEDMIAGLESKDPAVRQKALETKLMVMDALSSLSGREFDNYDRAQLSLILSMQDTVAAAQRLSEFLEIPLDMSQGLMDYANWLEQVNQKAQTAGRSLSDMASAAKSDLTSAFDAIKQKAEDYFRSVHEGNLEAIQDARDQKNAWLDAKMAREQRPVDRAQSALDHRMAQQQEYVLRQNLARATDPEAQLRAQWALRNFLDQQHIDQMQSEADKNKTRIQRQKDRNNELYQDQVDAENKRYDLQRRSFSRQLQALERFLKAHPEMWASAQGKVLALLRRFGGDFEDVGKKLGRKFRHGVERQIMKIMNDLKIISEYVSSKGGSEDLPDWFFGLFPGYASGTMRVAKDQLAFLHENEMVIPAGPAEKLRGMARGAKADDVPLWMPTGLPKMEARTAPSEDRQGKKGGGTVIFQIGSEKLAEITDRSLYVQESMYGRRRAMQVSRSVR